MKPPRVLLTSTSFQDTPGRHHELLASAGFELVCERGPIDETTMLQLTGGFDAFLCGDDAITAQVITRSAPRLKAISKYGIGLDKIDLGAAAAVGVPVFFTPGVNHTSVAEHTFALLLAVVRNLVAEANHVAAGRWDRMTGTELCGKTLAIVGLGRVGKEVAVRGHAFGMTVVGFGTYWDGSFAAAHHIQRIHTLEDLLRRADILSLHTKLTPFTRNLLNPDNFPLLKRGAILVNTGRGELIHLGALLGALSSGQLRAYAANVLDLEPPPRDHPLIGRPDVILTPHIGSRTFESVERLGSYAVDNLIRFFGGEEPRARATPH